MPRRARIAPGELVYHTLNRANGRNELICSKPEDYAAFERIMAAAMHRFPTRLLAYCLMPNHWHMVLWPRKDGEVTAFLRWLTLTHSQRLHAQRHTAGYGHIYQGRFKSFPIEQDQSLLNVLRYCRAQRIASESRRPAQDWRWCSLWGKLNGDRESLLSAWPLDRPENWVDWVNRAQTEAEVEAMRNCVNRGMPYGSEAWKARIANALGLESSLHPRGRPKKAVA